MKQMRDIVVGSLGVSARRLAVAFSAASPRSFLAVGFPLQSLTRNAVLVVALCLVACGVTAQDRITAQPTRISREAIEKLPVLDSSQVFKNVPLTFCPENSSLTDSVIVTGIVREQSSADVFCGVLCLSGTMKVEIVRLDSGKYPSQYIYAVLPCFVHDDQDIGHHIQIKLTPLPKSRDIGCFWNIVNSIDSEGAPFYLAEDWQIQ